MSLLIDGNDRAEVDAPRLNGPVVIRTRYGTFPQTISGQRDLMRNAVLSPTAYSMFLFRALGLIVLCICALLRALIAPSKVIYG